MDFMWVLEINFYFSKYQTCAYPDKTAVPYMFYPFFQLMHSTYSLDITCWSRITGLILCIRDQHCLPFMPYFLLQQAPGLKWFPFTTEPQLPAPLWTYAIAYTFSQSLCELVTPHSCYKGKGACQPHLKETRSLMLMKCQGFLSQNFRMTKKSSAPSQMQMPREPFPLIFSYVKISRGWNYFFFFLKTNCHRLWSTTTLTVWAWQTPMKMADEFQLFLFCCSYVWCSHFETWKCWNAIAILAW